MPGVTATRYRFKKRYRVAAGSAQPLHDYLHPHDSSIIRDYRLPRDPSYSTITVTAGESQRYHTERDTRAEIRGTRARIDRQTRKLTAEPSDIVAPVLWCQHLAVAKLRKCPAASFSSPALCHSESVARLALSSPHVTKKSHNVHYYVSSEHSSTMQLSEASSVAITTISAVKIRRRGVSAPRSDPHCLQ